MARINITLSDPLDEQMREYIEKNKLTITTFLHLAIAKYLESQEQSKNIKKLFTELLRQELKNQWYSKTKKKQGRKALLTKAPLFI